MRASQKNTFPMCAALLLAVAVHTHGQNLLSVEHERIYTASEVNSSASRLFGSGAPAAKYEVDVYLLHYQTLGMDDESTPIRARLFVPRFERTTVSPLYVFAAGTTGLTDACRTSREDEIGINWGLYQSHMMAHAGQGTIGILPDYMYFGDSSRLQPYFIPDAEARVLLDAVRATHSFFRDDNGLASAAGSLSNAVPSEGAVLAGFSQGGHAIFAAADRVRKYAPEVTIAGLIGYGPTTDIEQIFRDFTVVAAPIIYTYAQRYGTDRFNPEVMIRDRWLNNLEADVQRLCILGLQDYYPWGPDTFFQPAFLDALLNRRLETAFPEIHAILRENSTGLSGHGIPALILQGGNDVVISEADQTEFVLDLRDNSSDVRYIVYPDSRHDTRQIGFSEAQNWIIQRTISEE